MRRAAGHAARPVFFLALLLLLRCSSSPVGVGPVVEGVDLGVLFAPPTAAEIAAVRAEWAARDPAPVGVQVVLEKPFAIPGNVGVLRVISHVVDGNVHYGAVIAPSTNAALPVLVLLHGGDEGIDVTDPDIAAVVFALGEAADDFVYVIPSFRSEPLEVDGTTYLSGGAPSPWDRDVDDVMALLGAALLTTPVADPTRVAAVGLSRGGLVALLMGIRDARVDRVIEFMGPTDFFDDFVRDVIVEALEGQPRDLPGLSVLNTLFIQPLKNGEISEADLRRELVRRSAVLFASDLPSLQLHHGTADPVVDVSQAESLIETMARLGRGAPDFEGYLYEGGVHDPLTMPGSVSRAVAFLAPLTGP